MSKRSTVLSELARPKRRGKAQIAFAAALSCMPTSRGGEKEEACTSCDEARLLVLADCGSISAPGWAAISPFGVPSSSLPAALRNWCLLTAPVGTTTPSLPAQLGEDPPNVVPQSNLFAQVMWPWLHARFLNQTSAANLPAGQAPSDAVEVAVIDDAEDVSCAPGEPGIGTRKHGRTLGLMIRELNCPSGQTDCPVYIANHRALRCDGGLRGTRVQLARSIYEAVVGWQAREASRPSRSRLVINLSVGYEETGGLPSLLVRQAINLAVCHGALVIGAAGNVLPDGSGSGPLMPGGLESIPSPSSCSAFAMNDPRGFEANPPVRPLVIAAAGVEAQNIWLPLTTTRPGGRPALATAAFQAVVGDPQTGSPPGPSAVLTGSSVSSAVISAIAAMLWSRMPNLAPEEVIDAIRSSGTPLGEYADFGLAPAQNAEIHVAGACNALAYACSMYGSPACGPLANWSCSAPDPSASAWPISMVTSTYFPTDQFDICEQATSPNLRPRCSDLVEVELPWPMCSGDDGANVGPQPGDLGCGACSVNANGSELYLVIDDTYKGDFIPTNIAFKQLDTSIVYPFQPLNLPVLRAGEKMLVMLAPGADPIPSAGQAWIEFVSDAYQQTRYVPIAWW